MSEAKAQRKQAYPKGGGAQGRIICDETIDLVIQLLARRKPKSIIKATLNHLLWPKGEDSLNACTVEEIIKRARQKMCNQALRDRKWHKVDAISFLEDVIADDKSYVKDRLQAQEQLSKLTGIEYSTELAERQLAAKSGVGGTAEQLGEQVRGIMKEIEDSVS